MPLRNDKYDTDSAHNHNNHPTRCYFTPDRNRNAILFLPRMSLVILLTVFDSFARLMSCGFFTQYRLKISGNNELHVPIGK